MPQSHNQQQDEPETTPSPDNTPDEEIEKDETNEEEQNSPVTLSVAEYEELKTLAEERDEYLNRLREAVADRMKLQKRIKKIKKEAQEKALRTVARKVLPLADSLTRALDVAEETEGAEQITEGLNLTEQEFYGMLDDLGIELIESVGEKFDPNYHEAVFQQPTDDAEPNTVVQEIKKGFLLNGDLLRPAQVVVATEPESDEPEDAE